MARVCRHNVFLLQIVVYNLPISDMIFHEHVADQAGYVMADADAGRWVSQTLASQLKMLLVAESSWASSARLYAWGPQPYHDFFNATGIRCVYVNPQGPLQGPLQSSLCAPRHAMEVDMHGRHCTAWHADGPKWPIPPAIHRRLRSCAIVVLTCSIRLQSAASVMCTCMWRMLACSLTGVCSTPGLQSRICSPL